MRPKKHTYGKKQLGGPQPRIANTGAKGQLYQSQAELDAEQAWLDRKYEITDPTHSGIRPILGRKIGDPVLPILDRSGLKIPQKPLATTWPSDAYIETGGGAVWYTNNDGNLVDIDPSYYNGKLGIASKEKQLSDLASRSAPQMQRGGRAPIYTKNPNDPRLQNYKDSMYLYNRTRGMIDKAKNMKMAEYWAQMEDEEVEVNEAYERLNAPEPVRKFRNRTGEGEAVAIEFGKPVQPVIFGDAPPPPPPPVPRRRNFPRGNMSRVQAPDLNTPYQQMPADLGLNLPQTPQGKYSFTYPTFEGGNSQKSIYFQNAENWKNFLRGKKVSTQEGADYGSATGVLQAGGKYIGPASPLPSDFWNDQQRQTEMAKLNPAFQRQQAAQQANRPVIQDTERGLLDDAVAVQAAVTGANFLSNYMQRGRQNQYDWDQQSALGMVNPMPTDDYQPNPYSVYAKYGGNLKNIVKDFNKYSNDAQFDFGSGDNDQGMMKKGGYELDRMFLMRKVFPELFRMGRMGSRNWK